jgi:Zn-dependent M16 (insulinase) family peptidase
VLPVYKYKSKRTGLTVVISQAESPIVNGYFCFATEAFNNDGLPHTLEHLVFLGRYVTMTITFTSSTSQRTTK